MKIVIDTLGSDNKLDSILDGVVESSKMQSKFDYVLVGPEKYITNYLNDKID